MKNFIVYECLMPLALCGILMLPLVAVHACVSMGPGDTYTIDSYGSSMVPAKDEMSPSTSGKGGGLIWEETTEPRATTFMNKPRF